jgi:hypothetical protein
MKHRHPHDSRAAQGVDRSETSRLVTGHAVVSRDGFRFGVFAVWLGCLAKFEICKSALSKLLMHEKLTQPVFNLV